MIVEVPRWTHAKLEISLDEELNPIKHVLFIPLFDKQLMLQAFVIINRILIKMDTFDILPIHFLAMATCGIMELCLKPGKTLIMLIPLQNAKEMEIL